MRPDGDKTVSELIQEIHDLAEQVKDKMAYARVLEVNLQRHAVIKGSQPYSVSVRFDVGGRTEVRWIYGNTINQAVERTRYILSGMLES